jgi:hypothetical protein
LHFLREQKKKSTFLIHMKLTTSIARTNRTIYVMFQLRGENAVPVFLGRISTVSEEFSGEKSHFVDTPPVPGRVRRRRAQPVELLSWGWWSHFSIYTDTLRLETLGVQGRRLRPCDGDERRPTDMPSLIRVATKWFPLF